jgi:hypothetical protein
VSQGTGSSYRVVSAEELARRALAASRARCGALEERLTLARAEAAALGARALDTVDQPRGNSLEAWEAYERVLAGDVDRSQSLVEVSRRAMWADQMSAQLQTFSLDVHFDLGGDPTPDVGPASEAAEQSVADDARTKVQNSLEHALRVASGIDDVAAREQAVSSAREILAGLADDPAGARARLSLLRSGIEAALAEQELGHHIRRQAEALAVEAAGIVGIEPQDLQALQELAASVRSAHDLDLARSRVDVVRAETTAELDRRFVIDQTAKALARMGYVVGEEFVTSALNGRAVVQPPGLPGHGLELDFERTRPWIITETVSVTGHEADVRSDDSAAVAQACDDVDALAATLAGAGVALTRSHTLDFGEVPVRLVATQERASDRSAARGRTKRKQREAGAS